MTSVARATVSIHSGSSATSPRSRWSTCRTWDHRLGDPLASPLQLLGVSNHPGTYLIGQFSGGPGRGLFVLFWHAASLAASGHSAAAHRYPNSGLLCRRAPSSHTGFPLTSKPAILDGMDEPIDRAPRRVELALDHDHADHPDLVIEPPPAAPQRLAPQPRPTPTTTGQWAETTRLRASALRQEALQIRQQTAQLHQATRA
jgi:hypothetical protein